MNDELRVTVVATGIGMDKRPEITLVTNKQVQQPVNGSLPATRHGAVDARTEAGSESG
jgi:hypothetical protein